MVDSHWICYNTGKPFEANLEKFGFVYIITNTKSGKAYVGCKQYYIGRTKKQHKWETYMSSSKYLKADIEKIGKKHFIFEVIAEYKNKRSLNYYEAYYQMKWNVLTATLIADSDEPAYYNSYVGGKWYRPIESYKDPETRQKIRETKLGDKNPMYGKNFSKEHRKKLSNATTGSKNPSYKGKVEFYLDGKRMEVDCINVWCKENGYPHNTLCHMIRTARDGFYEFVRYKGKPKRKGQRLTCKGPLGTITKAKRLRKEVNNVSQESNV